MKDILVAIDFGAASERALSEARRLAKAFDSALHLVCVVQDPFWLPWAPSARPEMLAALLARMQQETQAHLEQVAKDVPTRHAPQVATRVGKPAGEILAYAGEHGIDLIVVGKDGHGGPAAATGMGSVAEAVARDARCPVLVVPTT
ncbi:MAG: universal stress protein [Vicinamibacterales bacterium]|nr:universal stress protein [Vicinamibacterales bacterium]